MAGLTALLILLVPGVAVARAYPDRGTVNLNLRADTEAADYGRETLAAAAPGSIVFPHGDGPIFALWYQRYVLAKDSGISIVSRELLQFAWYRDELRRREPDLMLPPEPGVNARQAIRALAAANFGKREAYATWKDPYLDGFALEPVGEHLFRVTAKP